MRKMSIFLLCLLVLGTSNGVRALDLHAQTSDSIAVNFGDEVTTTYSNFTSLQPDLPDIGTYIENNVSDFSSDGTTEYVGEDVITELTDTFYVITITLVDVAIGDDTKDLGSAGEIFVEGHANGNYTRFPDIGNELSLDANQNVAVSAQLLVSTAYTYNITMEVRESDTGSDDSLGFVTHVPTTVANETLVLNTNTAEATLTFDVEALEVNEITAEDVLNGNKPYLHVDDETGETELPNDMVGRIIMGNDNGRQAMVLQYFFYWDAEFSPDGGVYSFELHKNDFEAFYVYYDLSNFGEPYRLVFNNYIYSQVPGFPNENLLIIEEGATAGESNYTSEISDELQLVLGASTLQDARTLPMSSLDNWEYNSLLNQEENARIPSLMGATTVQLTVDTSYHTFDLGPGGEEYGFDYTDSSELNDSRIKDWYAIIDDTFGNGTKVWSYFGIDVPEVGPFTFDVKQVFNAPYVITGYSSVSQDTAAIERAKNSYLNMTQFLEITVSYNFPSTLGISYNDQMSAGSTSLATLTYIPSSNLEITVQFDYELKANLSFWLVQASYNKTISNTFQFDIDTASVSSIADALGLGSFEVEDQDLGTYLALTGLTIYPTLFGTILEGSLELDLWAVIETIFRNSHPLAVVILNAIGYILDSFVLSLDFSVSGVVTVPISTSSSSASLNTTELTFSDDKLIHVVEIASSNDASDFELVIGDIAYGWNFNIEWVIKVAFKSPVSSFVSGFEWSIGIFPDITEDLYESPGDSFAIAIDQPDDGDDGDSPFLIEMGIIAMILMVPLIRRRRN